MRPLHHVNILYEERTVRPHASSPKLINKYRVGAGGYRLH
jgi:hypothetical protein